MNAARFPPAFVARPLLAFTILTVALPAITGCAGLVVPLAVQGTLYAVDRRSAGAKLNDQTIELKILTAAGTKWGNDIHLNVTSYNGVILMTGEAPSQAIRDEIAQLAKDTVPVRSVHDEMVIGPVTDLGARSNDTLITSKVKARFAEADKVPVTAVTVVTERSVVYLMGIVSREESADAALLASTTSGVVRVVKLFEYTN